MADAVESVRQLGGNILSEVRENAGLRFGNVGAPADVAVLELRQGEFEFVDNYKGTRTGTQKLFPAGAVIGGKRI